MPALPSLIHEVQAAEQAVGLAVRPGGEIEEVRTSEARAVAKGEAPEAIDLDGLPIVAAQISPLPPAFQAEGHQGAVAEVADDRGET